MIDMNVQIIRSPRRKTLTIIVERDQKIVVRAPEGLPEEEVNRVVEAKRQWILDKIRHPQKYKPRPHAPGKEVVNGESALYLGKEYRIEVSETLSGEIEFDRLFKVPPTHLAKRRRVLRDWYLVRARSEILIRVDRYARELGVNYRAAKIVDSRYRWGSCTVSSNVNINWRLIKAPPFVIDYVIVHELAHLIEGSHSAEFWNIVRAKVPMLDKAKAWLKENGQMLEEDV